MASFIAKQLVGNKLNAVKGAVGGGEEKKSEEDQKKDEEEQQAILEARREEEEKRREKHRKMEEEREDVREQIRKKYGIKKKEQFPGFEDPNRAGQIGRKRKTPEELAAESRGGGNEEEGFLPANMTDITSKLTQGPGQMISNAQEKCSLM